MSIDRKLSTLELTALGVMSKRGPCTAYAVMAEFVHSTTSAYRSGAGSIYPLLRRLQNAGLIQSSEAGKKLLELTPAGREAIREWFTTNLSADDFSCSLDVLRSRMYFMWVLTPEERVQYLDEALQGLKLLLQKCQQQLEGYKRLGDPFSLMAMEGAVIETQARIKWIKKCQKALNR